MLHLSLPQGDQVEAWIAAEDARSEREQQEEAQRKQEVEAANAIGLRWRRADNPDLKARGADSDAGEQMIESSEVEERSESEYGEDDEMPPPTRRSTTKPASRSKPAASTHEAIKNEALASATSVKTRLPTCTIGATELMTFFPHHEQWPEAGLRLFRNGWKNADVATIQLHARDKLSQTAYTRRRDALRKSVLTNGKAFFQKPDFKPSVDTELMSAVTSYDATRYQPKGDIRSRLEDAKLVDIAEGVVNWPQGEDRGIVTQVIEHAHQNDFSQYIAADIPQIAQQMGFVAPVEASRADWDQRALARVQQIPGP